MNRLITVLDLGASEMAAATGRIDKGGNVSLLGFESMPSAGLRHGEIVDINRAAEDISTVLRRLTRAQQKKIKKLHVTIKGNDVRVEVSRGMVPLSNTPREITKRDIRKCHEIASIMNFPIDRMVIQKIVKAFYINGGNLNIKNPLGLYGVKLEMESFIATADRSKTQTIVKSVDYAGFLLEGLYLSGIASATGILSDADMERGALLLDIRDSLTEAIAFKNGFLYAYFVTGKGTDFIIRADGHPDKDRLSSVLNEVRSAMPGMEKAFSQIIATGSGALVDGIIEEVESRFNIPTNMGMVKDPGKGLQPKDALIHTSTIGQIKYLAREYKSDTSDANPASKAFKRLLDIYESYF